MWQADELDVWFRGWARVSDGEAPVGVIDYTRDGAVGTIVVSDPPQNRLTLSMIDDFGEALNCVGTTEVRALVIRGAGENFSCGGDVQGWFDMDADAAEVRHYLLRLNQLFQQIEELPVPVIAAVRGLCTGGGLELALHCDLVVAARDAQLRFPETGIALSPVGGGVQRVAERAGRAGAARLAMLADTITGVDAERMGLVARLVDAEEVLYVADELAHRLGGGPTLAYATIKQLLLTWSQGGVGAADRMMLAAAQPSLESQEFRGGIRRAVAAIRATTSHTSQDWRGE